MPELPKRPLECQNGNSKPPKDNPRSQKLPAAEGVALKIRRTPAGGARRDWNIASCSAESEELDRPRPPSAGRSQKSYKNHKFSSPNSSMLSCMQNLQNLRKWTPTETLFGNPNAQTSRKMPSRQRHKKHIQIVSKHDAKTKAQHLKNKHFSFKMLHLVSFAAYAKIRRAFAQGVSDHR